MAGSSLWLVPPPSHPLHAAIARLIETTLPAGQFPDATPRPPAFAPHLTLTSSIDPAVYGADPQAWLDGIPFPGGGSQVRVVFERVATEDFYFRRCYLKCGFDRVREVAGMARARGVLGEEGVGEETERWLAGWRASFGPHVSLVYGDMPIDEAKLKGIDKAVRDAGITFAGPAGSEVGGVGMGGWEGGVVWLVPTDKDIAAWKPIATRAL